MDLLGHDGKVTSDMETIFISNQKYKGHNKDYSSHFSAIFESRFLTVFIRLALGKNGVDRVTGSWRENGDKYEFDFKVI